MPKLAACDVILMTFSVGECIREDIVDLRRALNAAGVTTRALVLTERPDIVYPVDLEVVQCEPGSKLKKIKSQLSGDNPFICVIDSDMRLKLPVCKELVLRAMSESAGITFGLIESSSVPGSMGNCIQLDKRWSHRFLRPALHFCGVGITVPGQFVVYSPRLLATINDGTDTFLDDLYFGLKCRQQGLGILRINKIVGYEEGRSGWSGLLLQRIRWMKGLFRLTRDAWTGGAGWSYCIIHYLAYHGLPIAYVAFILALILSHHGATALCLIIAFLAVFATVTRSLSPALLLYAAAFPILHAVATLGALLPFSIKNLRRR